MEAISGWEASPSIVPSHLGLRVDKPAGIIPPAHHQEVRMLPHLLFLLLIVVVLGLEVKVILRKR
jgi:hypothetical protein